jgi:tripartite-type tricarboxylate transporter receptor subunit TctC
MLRLLTFVLAMFAMSASAQELRIITPSPADSYNINARILAPYLVKYLPEKPSPVIQVMPGASSLVATNYMYNVAPKDGNTIATVYKNIPLVGILGGQTIMFDPTKFNWIGSTVDGRKDAVIVWTHRTETLNEFRVKEFVVGTESIVSADSTKFIRNALGMKFRQVAGYANPGAARLALERKEVDAVIFNLLGIKTQTQWTEPNSGIRAILQFGNGKNRHPDFKSVPTFAELITNEDDRAILDIFETQFILLRPFIAPPGVPTARVAELRDAFNKAVNDKGYIEEATKARMEVELITGEQAEQIVAVSSNASPTVLNKLRALQSEQ